MACNVEIGFASTISAARCSQLWRTDGREKCTILAANCYPHDLANELLNACTASLHLTVTIFVVVLYSRFRCLLRSA